MDPTLSTRAPSVTTAPRSTAPRDARSLPAALDAWDDLVAAIGGRRPALFLDYDGTLTPIVDRPEDAVLSDDGRSLLGAVAARFPTALVTGRGRDDLTRLAGLDRIGEVPGHKRPGEHGGLTVAGSHGFDIAGPGISHRVGEHLEPVIARLAARLERELADVEGAVVEPKRVTLAVHHRLVAPERRAEVEDRVDQAVASHPELEKAGGKEVWEIRPRIDWHKGRAVEHLLDVLGLDRPDVVPLYLGDDVTDEDAFRALDAPESGATAPTAPSDRAAARRRSRGIGVLVAGADEIGASDGREIGDGPARTTAAHYRLEGPEQVRTFLHRLLELPAPSEGQPDRHEPDHDAPPQHTGTTQERESAP